MSEGFDKNTGVSSWKISSLVTLVPVASVPVVVEYVATLREKRRSLLLAFVVPPSQPGICSTSSIIASVAE